MADVFTVRKRSEIMGRVRSRRNRSTELALASAFRVAGITGWRRHLPIPGSPDFAFPSVKLAVFVDGCFWHGCPKHGTMPATNKDFWNNKIATNKRRDRKVTAILKSNGWRIVRIWEHDTRRHVDRAVLRVEKVLEKMRRAKNHFR
jgi:DNA mismatch endonuclease (patch repair protein)